MKALAIAALFCAAALPGAGAQGRYADVNGIHMYYEVHGAGSPLVLIHGGGSTIHTNFAHVIPMFAKKHRVIAVELQAHGHTSDRGVPSSFAQDAADVAELLKQLKIPRADILGFSNGGQTAIELGLHYPGVVRKLVIASAFTKRSGVPAPFWNAMQNAQFSDMPPVYKDEFRKINKDPAALMTMFTRDSHRMQTFTGWPDDAIRSITAPSLVVAGDRDVLTPEHAVEMSRLLPHARLVILPSAHGTYLAEIATAVPGSSLPALFVGLVDEFLAAPMDAK